MTRARDVPDGLADTDLDEVTGAAGHKALTAFPDVCTVPSPVPPVPVPYPVVSPGADTTTAKKK